MKLGDVIEDSCDICWFLGNTEKQRVRKVNEDGLVLCKPCYKSMETIER